MDISIFLAKSIGLYLVIISVGMILNGNKLKPAIREILKNPALVLFSGILALIIGILMIVAHNIWVKDWRVIITVLGWLTLIKGASRLFFPDYVINATTKWVEHKVAYYVTMFLTLLLGFILLYFGYFQGS